LLELAGHSGTITTCKFLNHNYVVSGSEDSNIILWDLNNPDRFLVKYNEH